MALTDLFESHRTGVAQVVLEQDRSRIRAGTAFLVPGGLVTNSHVIRAAQAEAFGFRFSDMGDGELIRLAETDVLGAARHESPENGWDVVFLEIDQPEFDNRHRFEFAPSAAVNVGQQLAFLGFPFQLPNLTCHVAYVSSMFERNGVDVIQLDASVNGGNSGGPLIDPDTETVVGIVTRAHSGFVAEQFDKLIGALRNNVEVLGQQRATMTIGGVDPVQAIRASQAAMVEIAQNLRRSANVGIGYAFSSRYISDALQT